MKTLKDKLNELDANCKDKLKELATHRRRLRHLLKKCDTLLSEYNALFDSYLEVDAQLAKADPTYKSKVVRKCK